MKRRREVPSSSDEDTTTSGQRAGTVMSLRLVNFMCHENFEIKFGPHITFVIGENGSGKSAVLTGLVLGLGGRASVTSRGHAIANFVKKGASMAKIIVKLNNHERNKKSCWRYDVYGKSIIVERTIRDNGTSNYAVRNKQEKTISNAKSEVDKIVQFFSLQLDNPVCILNQEVSRNFLNNSDPKRKYEFYMRATRLQETYEAYQNALDNKTKAQEELDNKVKHEPAIRNDIKKLEERVNILDSIQLMRSNRRQNNANLAWKLVEEEEEKVKQAVDEVKRVEHMREKLDQKENRYKENIEELKQQRTSAELQLQNLELEKDQIMTKLDQMSQEMNECRKQKKEKDVDLVHERRRADTTRKEIRDVENEITKHEKANEAYNRRIEERQKALDRINELSEQILELESQEREVNSDVLKLGSQINPLKSQMNELQAERNELQNQLNSCTRRKNQLETNSSNNLAMYGDQIIRLCQEIDRLEKLGHFKVKPIGPLGAFITLKDQSTKTAMQACFAKHAKTFAVQHEIDKQVLLKIIKKVYTSGRHPQVVLMPFHGRRYDISENKVCHPKYRSMLDYLTFANDFVFNVLVDLSRAENIAYIPDDREATEMLVRIENVPQNCQQAYTSTGTVLHAVSHNRPFRSYPYDRRDQDSSIFQQDVKGEIAHLAARAQDIQLKIQEINRDGQSIDEEYKRLINEQNGIKRKLGGIQERRQGLQREKQRITVLPEPQMVETISLRNELTTLKEKLEHQMETVKQHEADVKKITNELQAKDDEYQQLESKKIDLESGSGPRRVIQQINHDIEVYNKKIQDLDNTRTKLDSDKAEKEKVLEEAEARVAAKTKEASKICKNRDECRSRKSSEQIRRDIAHLDFRIEQQERDTGDPDELRRDLEERRKEYDKMTADINAVKELIERLGNSITDRKTTYKRMRTNITEEVAEQFKNGLDMMDFTGDLKVHFKGEKKEQLEIRVNPKAKTSEHACRDTRSLSGGERSFSTVAFLIALWEHTESPLRILDEVDVFMDMVTRNIALDTIMQSARTKGNQFIMLSPLPLIDDEKMMEGVVIQKMPAPKRI